MEVTSSSGASRAQAKSAMVVETGGISAARWRRRTTTGSKTDQASRSLFSVFALGASSISNLPLATRRAPVGNGTRIAMGVAALVGCEEQPTLQGLTPAAGGGEECSEEGCS